MCRGLALFASQWPRFAASDAFFEILTYLVPAAIVRPQFAERKLLALVLLWFVSGSNGAILSRTLKRA